MPFATKIRAAITDGYSLERLGKILTPEDTKLMDSFRSNLLAAGEAEAKIVDNMYRDLCRQIEDLDAQSIAAEVKRMDQVFIRRQDERAETFLKSLTPEAAEAVRAEADRVVSNLKGVNTDFEGMARQHADFVKDHFKRTCAMLRAAGRFDQ